MLIVIEMSGIFLPVLCQRVPSKCTCCRQMYCQFKWEQAVAQQRNNVQNGVQKEGFISGAAMIEEFWSVDRSVMTLVTQNCLLIKVIIITSKDKNAEFFSFLDEKICRLLIGGFRTRNSLYYAPGAVQGSDYQHYTVVTRVSNQNM